MLRQASDFDRVSGKAIAEIFGAMSEVASLDLATDRLAAAYEADRRRRLEHGALRSVKAPYYTRAL